MNAKEVIKYHFLFCLQDAHSIVSIVEKNISTIPSFDKFFSKLPIKYSYHARERWNMYYELYVDVLLLVNFFMDYILLMFVWASTGRST